MSPFSPYAAAVFLPLVGAIVAGLFGRLIGDRAAQLVTCGAMILSAAIGAWMLYDVAWRGQVVSVEVLRWIESGDLENLTNVRIEMDQLEAHPGVHQALLGGEEDAEPRARDVLQIREIHDRRGAHPLQELLDPARLRRVEAAGEPDGAFVVESDIEHLAQPPRFLRTDTLISRFLYS